MKALDDLRVLWQAALPQHPVSREGLAFRLKGPQNRRLIWRAGQLVAAAEIAPPAKPWAAESRTGHLRYLLVHSAWQRRGLGSELLAWAEGRLRELGAGEAALGGEPWHFFPGPPEGQAAFFAARGYAVGAPAACDLRRELKDLPPIPEAPGLRFGPLEDAQALDAFLREVFPTRWRWDALEVARLAPRQVLVLTRGELVRGFALTGREGDPVPLPSFLWAAALTGGAGIAGGLGPMGLHPDERGRGSGRALLRAAMHHLAARGVTHMGIDWTGIAPFYEESGFRVWRRYHTGSKALAGTDPPRHRPCAP